MQLPVILESDVKQKDNRERCRIRPTTHIPGHVASHCHTVEWKQAVHAAHLHVLKVIDHRKIWVASAAQQVMLTGSLARGLTCEQVNISCWQWSAACIHVAILSR